jgi:hypothetical protein
MRIGELLIEQRKLRAGDLTRALAEKPATKRLCSFLIATGLIDFDDGSRALGEQFSVACALAKHLAGRDPTLAKLIPPELGRGSCVLPIGKTTKGSVIVCVRDPAPALQRALEQAMRAEIMVVVAPASRIESLVAEAYGTGSDEELDIDFDVAPDQPSIHPRAETPAPLPPLPDMDALDPESIRLSLTDLDDDRVDKDPGQSGQMPKLGGGSTLPPAHKPVSTNVNITTRSSAMTRPMSLEMMTIGLEHSQTREDATDLVLSYVATRWAAGIVLAIRDKTAIGYRGFGVTAPESVTLSLGLPSTVQRAVETRFVSIEAPSGAGQSTLSQALNGPSAPAAAPIVVNGTAVAVIAVSDPLDGPAARDIAAADLAMLAEALGSAYKRIMAR